ncbi:MAG TPA: HEAT repeat domain-containing protein [Turneriella sp.]|nr:HEAT repeat domain-containing protein [Turneriella sp.]
MHSSKKMILPPKQIQRDASKTQKIIRLLLSLSLLVLSARCISSQTTDNGTHRITLEEFNTLDWQQQVETIEKMNTSFFTDEDKKIIASALLDDDGAVIVAALEAVWRLKISDFLSQAVVLVDSPDPIIRWRSLLAIEKLGFDDTYRDLVAKAINDKEWMVRETAYRTLRNFKKEHNEKKYFYSVLFKLNEQNPQVVAEIYRTLVWYKDTAAYPYMIKRSYHCKSVSELILVMRELARTQTRDAQVRLKTLTRSQSAMVRTEADKLLDEYY